MERSLEHWKKGERTKVPCARVVKRDEKGTPAPRWVPRGTMKGQIPPLQNPATWAKQTTRRLSAEFERIQRFLASPSSLEIEQDLVDTKRRVARLNEYPSDRPEPFFRTAGE